MKTRRIFAIALCLILLSTLLGGCSAKAPNDGGYYATAPNAGAELSGNGADSAGSNDVLANRKLIRRITMDAETEDMDALLSDINSRIAALGGYIESRNVQNGSAYTDRRYRHATLVIRIPAKDLDSFIQQVGDTSNVVSTTETSDDVTMKYVDTESRLKVLRTEEERLLQFLSEAKSTSEMLEIEKRLTTVQTEIESLTSQLKTYDNLVDYGTVTLNITEVEIFTVVEEKDPTMGEQITKAFQTSIQSLVRIGKALLVFLLGNSPYLILIGVIGLGIWLFIRAYDRHQKRKRTPPPTKDTP